LRVLTWNVGQIHGGWDSRAADADLAHIARVIRQSRADVVALQELRSAEQLAALAALLGPSYQGRVPDQDSYDRKVAVLIGRGAGSGRGKPRGRSESDGAAIDFPTVYTSSGRGAVGVRLRLEPRLDVTVVSVHLDAFDAERRRVQAEELLDWAGRLPDGEVLLAGDFNFELDLFDRGRRAVPERWLYDLLSRTYIDVGRQAGVTTALSRRIDYIFLRGTRLRVTSARALAGQRQRLMDHHPLLAELRW
jgi:endonuclease/exonuclease/phosphatase family metal-dependent hydrolase